MIETFAECYWEANRASFEEKGYGWDGDTVHLLAFSIVMLNTDHHNPNIKKSRKMTQEQYDEEKRGWERREETGRDGERGGGVYEEHAPCVYSSPNPFFAFLIFRLLFVLLPQVSQDGPA
jgi:hypothetical protein